MNINKVDYAMYNKNPGRYTLIPGDAAGAPLCPYGNNYKWIGYDSKNKAFVRLTKSVFKRIIKNLNKNESDN
ncbi:MAG: hypothetical protein HKO89_06745 [Saprospiraceae bacterium]|nr:hypothetical protein [Bacteroidia bacterium]NNK90291.1 hypothetical protein [Saprospiraceae bacterium]